MASSPSALPVIDLKLMDSSDPEKTAVVLEQWNHAFRTFGFCYLISHGLEQQYETVERLSLQFFTELTPQEKQQYYLNKGYGHGGYVPKGIEKVEASRSSKASEARPDPVESLCVHDSQATHVPPFSFDGDASNTSYKYGLEFKQAVQKLWSGLEELLHKLMTMSAKSLQLEEAYFEQHYRPGANFLRLAHYVVDTEKNPLRYGEHTDYQGFTLLWRNQTNGLQCASNMRDVIDKKMPVQGWIDIPVLKDNPSALVINAGDLIQRWTNDYWISNLHRVHMPSSEAPLAENNKKEPLSIVFFTGPDHETVVEKLPSPLLKDAAPKYEAVTAGDHLKMKIEPTSSTNDR